MSMTVSKRYPANELPAADPCCPDHRGRTLLDTREVAGLPDCLCNVCHTQLIYKQPELGWTRARLARPKGFRFKRVGRSIRGERRTFIIPGVGIFQRVGRRKNSRIRLLYRFKTSVPIDRRLDFIANAERVVQQMFDRNFDRAFDRAVAR